MITKSETRYFNDGIIDSKLIVYAFYFVTLGIVNHVVNFEVKNHHDSEECVGRWKVKKLK